MNRLKNLKPGKYHWLERNLFAYRTKMGELHYGISYTAPNGKIVREMVGASKTLARKVLAKRRAEMAEGRFEFPTRKQLPTFAAFGVIYLDRHSMKAKRSFARDIGTLKVMAKYLLQDARRMAAANLILFSSV